MKKENLKKSECLFVVVNLILSIVAISFLIGLEVEVVSAEVGDFTPAGQFNTESMTDEEASQLWNKHLQDEIKKNPTVSNTPVDPSVTVKDLPDPGFGTETTTETGERGLFSIFAKPKRIGGGILQGLSWATTAYMVVGLVGGWLGLEEPLTNSLQWGVSSGLFTAGVLRSEAIKGFFGSHAFLTGAVVGVVVFALTYKEVEYKTITFDCQPWEAPIGGSDCEKCNDELHACSEYRCKSLGQGCGILNEGTESEMCADLYEGNVKSPGIRPWEDVLTDGYDYKPMSQRPLSRGAQIIRQGITGRCIEAFTPIEFGIQTNMPAQCKIDIVPTVGHGAQAYEPAGYDDMEYYFGESSLFAYNHTQRMNLPSPDAINDFADSTNQTETGGLEIENDGRYELYIRCVSPNGYYNAEPYVMKFCVDKGPDATAPIIEEFSIADNSPVQYEVDEVPIVVYTNEPANCRWTRDNDLNFDTMENIMECADNLWEMNANMLYTCSGTLTGIVDREDNDYYFRCEDQPWMDKADRNKMSQGRKLTLRGTQPLTILDDSLKPKEGEVIRGATTTVEVNLELETRNGEDDKGTSVCYYGLDNSNFIEFLETNSFEHKQSQYLPAGTYTYYIKCVDLGGNQASTNTTFTVFVDTQAPEVVRVLFNVDSLQIITNENADCFYSTNDNTKCDFNIGEDAIVEQMMHESSDKLTEHFAPWEVDEAYYIKCVDDSGKQPLPTECSMIVKPVEIGE